MESKKKTIEDTENNNKKGKAADAAAQERPVVHVAGTRHASKSTDDEENEGTALGLVKSLVIDVVIACCLAAALLYFIRPTMVKQSSMENTLHNNDYMIMSRQSYRNHGPERGDIIIFQSDLPGESSDEKKLLIKRVIGLPGDEISIKEDQLYINGEKYEEDYLKEGYTPAFDVPAEGETFTVPDNSYFCMGDNRASSIDSRCFEVGCVTPELIKGKVVLRLFPFNKIQRF